MRKYLLTIVFFGFLIHCKGQHAKDSVAIRLLLEKESATWRSGDIKAHASCWQIRPYSRILVSIGDGTVIDVPPQLMIAPPPEMAGKGGYSINTNYRMSIQGKHAWVSHQEESVATDGKRTFSYEIRILEKVKGYWKLWWGNLFTFTSPDRSECALGPSLPRNSSTSLPINLAITGIE